MTNECRSTGSRLKQALVIVASACALTTAGAQVPAKPAASATPKPASKSSPAKAAVKAPAALPLPAADAEQLSAAGIAHLGDYPCELGESVSVLATPSYEGYVDVHHKKAVHTMKPVLSSTGALRLEDVRGRMLMLQIANKSMLMDVKAGQRVVDNCVHEKQQAAAALPPTESLGIDPAKAAASAPN